MISPDLIYRVGLGRIDDLRREAKAWRWIELARAELNALPSSTEKGGAPMARATNQPTAGEHDHPWDGASEHRVTASEWFASGARRPYDSVA